MQKSLNQLVVQGIDFLGNSLTLFGSLFCPGRLTLAPPVITYDAVTSRPPSPSQSYQHAGDGSPGCYQVQSSRSRNVLVTPRGSFLAVNQSPIEFRESMLSISYPNYTGTLSEISYDVGSDVLGAP